MNKIALKNFATQSRRKLIEQVQTKALLYGIDEKNGLHIEEQFGQLLINGQTYPLSMKSAFTALQQQLEQKGYKQLIEEAAYTWFNRVIAIRYMEVHEYLPERVNVLSSSVGRVDPDILFEFDTMDLAIKAEEVRELINTGNTEAAYRILFVAQCNALNRILPFMFEPIQDYTELLLPDFLLDAESVIKTFVQSEELTESFAEIEVIGWLYQYYNLEPKDLVFENLKNNKKIEKYDIPPATQLFTPKWVVQYMVENSLGHLWLESANTSKLKDNMKYHISPLIQENSTKYAPDNLRYTKINLEEISIIDPCVGSGHILVYAFDLLYQMYEEQGYRNNEISKLILEKNIYGLDIDSRAVQLASFALMMCARKRDKRILKQHVNLNVFSFIESNNIDMNDVASLISEDDNDRNDLINILESYKYAESIGSIIELPKIDYDKYLSKIDEMKSNQLSIDNYMYYEQINIVKKIIKISKILTISYDIAITNPPYMGTKGMNVDLKKFISNKFPDSKSDLFSVFIERLKSFVKEDGFYSLVTPPSWLFLGTYENLRKKVVRDSQIYSLLHMGRGIFGIDFGSVAFCLRNRKSLGYIGNYFRLHDKTFQYIDSRDIRKIFIDAKNNPDIKVDFSKYETNKPIPYSESGNQVAYINDQTRFYDLPLTAYIYWATDVLLNTFVKNKKLNDIADFRLGMATADNNKFLRLWYECDFSSIKFDARTREQASDSQKKWFPYNKGGDFRKWYGNCEYVVNWKNDGLEIRDFTDSKGKVRSHNYNLDFIFKPCITWSAISSGKFSSRFSPEGYIFDNAGSSCFTTSLDTIYLIQGYLSSKVASYILPLINPTLNYQPGTLGNLPLPEINEKVIELEIIEKVKGNIEIYKEDWDSYEFSWNFNTHPFVKYKESEIKLEEIYNKLVTIFNGKLQMLKSNEWELNSRFINLFELEDEISADVLDDEIVLRRANKYNDTVTFLSYFIGCVAGRFSLDKEGLIFAGGDLVDFEDSIFEPNINGIIQFTESEYLKNDIITRFKKFLSVIFNPIPVDENIEWIAEVLEMRNGEDAETRIRRYFLDEFFNEHCKMYQKRPIYWLVDSGKQKGLRTLIYMHRYQPDTMATIRFEHLQEIQAKYQQEIVDIENRLVNPNLSATDKKKLNAEKISFEKKIDELREFDKRLAAIAAEELEIDLDDGVKVNYEKFYRGGKGVLAKIK